MIQIFIDHVLFRPHWNLLDPIRPDWSFFFLYESKRHRAESQWIVAARPTPNWNLLHLIHTYWTLLDLIGTYCT